MTLHTIGYAALSYPSLAPELPIPLGNQLGVLQRQPLSSQIRMMSEIASQYLSALLTYQTSSAPHLHDPTNAQYYLSDAFALLNWLTTNPDVAIRCAKHPTLFKDTIDKLLDDNVERDMKACEATRTGGMTFEADFGSLLQFVSTILLRREFLPEPVHPRILELVPKLKAWKKKYRGKFIGRVAERLAAQIESPESLDLDAVRESQAESVVCGYVGCAVKKELLACGQCKVQRYCSTEHQKKDWKFHKKICNKGLIEDEE
jgi:hypothetical protein